MLNEDVLFSVLKDNFEKLTKTCLSEFENDLYYTKNKKLILKISKNDLVKFTTAEDDNGNKMNFFAYKHTPKFNWTEDSFSLFKYNFKIIDKQGKKQYFTEDNNIFNEISYINTDDIPISVFMASSTFETIKIFNGINPTSGNNDISSLESEDAFYFCYITDDINDVPSFEFELFEEVDKKIPVDCLDLESFKENLKQYFVSNVDAIVSNSITLGSRNMVDDIIGEKSFAIGDSVVASGNCSFVHGGRVKALGNNSYASGWETIASGSCSFASGNNTIASSDEQHAIGKYNIEDTENAYVCIVGNGRWGKDESDGNWKAFRSNAHTLDWDGNGWYAGKLSQEKTPTEDKDLATKKYVDDNVLTPAAKTLLATLLQNIPYSTDQSANVAAFLAELGIDTTQTTK